MDNLKLASDETILRRLSKIILRGIRCEAILTTRRFILVERGSGELIQEIPYTGIASAEARVNAIHEPILSITPVPSGEPLPAIELVFVYQPGGQNISEIERCITVFRDNGIPVQNYGIVSPKAPRSRTPAASLSLTSDDDESGKHPASSRTIAGRPWQSTRQLPPDEEPKTGSFGGLTLIIVIIAVIIGAGFLAGASLHSPPAPQVQKPVTPAPEITPEITMEIETEIATAVPTSALPATPAPDTKPRITEVPGKGIWAKISYPGQYGGYIGGDGRRIALNGSGTDFISLPFQNTTIDGFVEKKDGSADLLEVELFNGGILVTRAGTKTPYGIAEIHAPVGIAQGFGELPTPVVTTVSVLPTPDPSLTLRPVPSSGVWMRVAYPGTFGGSIASNGDWRPISGSGDQFYQLPMTSGLVEGSIDKTDDLRNNLVVEVYKDGSRVLVKNTTAPRGNVKVYTTV